jgi:hypothetical protein
VASFSSKLRAFKGAIAEWLNAHKLIENLQL